VLFCSYRVVICGAGWMLLLRAEGELADAVIDKVIAKMAMTNLCIASPSKNLFTMYDF
jgi:hypothetical protein